MNVESGVYDAFAAAAGAFAAQLSPALPVAYPGVHFVPPDSGLWLELRWFPGETENYGVGDSGPSMHRGIGQVSVCGRDGYGVAPMLRLADDVISYFAKGTTLGKGSVYRKPWQSSVLVDDGRVIVPVTVRWRAFVNG